MLAIAIDGHDGSAKSPICDGIDAALRAKGLEPYRTAPFHLVRDLLNGEDIYPLWATPEGRKRAVALLKQVIADVRKSAEEKGADVIIFDRHWMTVMTEIMDDPTLVHQWTDFPPTFFIQAPPSKTMSSKRFSFNMPWTSSVDTVSYYYKKFIEVADRYPTAIIERYTIEQRESPIAPCIASIVSHVEKLNVPSQQQ